MTNAPINLQDLRRRISMKAKTDRSWRFWGTVCPRVQDGNSAGRLSACQGK